MRRLHDWIIIKFLPAWAKESVYKENQKLREKVTELHNEIDRLNAYAAGLEYALKRRITIKNEVRQ